METEYTRAMFCTEKIGSNIIRKANLSDNKHTQWVISKSVLNMSNITTIRVLK